MEYWQKVTVAVVGVLVLAFGSFTLGYGLARDRGPLTIGTNEPEAGLRIIRDAYDKIRSSAVEQPTEEELARGAVRGMVKTLRTVVDDPYAFFYTPEGYESFQELTTGSFSGIGVWLKPDEGEIRVVSVLPDTPALRAGVRQGDVIVSIDGEPVDKMTLDEAVARIKGPSGTEVALTLLRGDERVELEITRERLDLPTMKSSVIDGIGYIRLLTFSRGAGEDLKAEVDRLVDDGVQGIVLDMRDNGGGLFDEAVDVASVFIEEGEIVTYDRANEDPVVYEAKGDAFEDVPVVVLVNAGTASASEIVAGALQDRDRAIVVGETTFGKGSVQRLVPLLDGSALKLTIGAYLTPDGTDINGEGIEPDVEIAARRAQKPRAIEILRGIVLSTTGSSS